MLLSKLDFASYLSYCSSKENSENIDKIKQSKDFMISLKREGMIKTSNGSIKVFSEFVAEKIKNNLIELSFKDFFGDDVALVPIPKSSLMQKDSLWVPDKIAKALASQGLGIYYPCLERSVAIFKSSYSKPENRPKPIDHFESINIKSLIAQPSQFVLVDDVVTRGSTMLGCASVLKERFPKATIRGFAVMRTISASGEFVSINSPVTGEITLLSNNETLRSP